MKIIINTTNLRWGGGIQSASSLLNEWNLNDYLNHEFYVFLSPAVQKELAEVSFHSNFHFFNFNGSPASLKHRKQINEKLDLLEQEIAPDIVYTIFGPAYWQPKNFHVEGFALGWITNPESIAYRKLPLLNRFKKKLENRYKILHLKREADHYIVETNDVKEKLSKVLKISREKITVIGNTYNTFFDNPEFPHLALPPKKDGVFRMITISHFYVHKNLDILQKVIPILNKSNLKFEFVLTIDDNNFRKHFSEFKEYIINVGPVDSKYCPSLYQQSDALFLPTLLESFTASYPEAIRMGLPILTSNYSFAREICQDAALYFDPLNPNDIAQKIILLASDSKIKDDLVRRGKRILKAFETPESRAKKTLALLETIKNR